MLYASRLFSGLPLQVVLFCINLSKLCVTYGIVMELNHQRSDGRLLLMYSKYFIAVV